MSPLDCFYEKRLDTALHGYNDLHNRWISDFDCFDRCLRTDRHPCRSFEHWRSNQTGLCVRANLSLTDDPSAIGHNAFVDYYEIVCRQDVQGLSVESIRFIAHCHISAVFPESIECPNGQLSVTVKLNGIDPQHVSLGDSGCAPIWSNHTHAQFITKIDQCSLVFHQWFFVFPAGIDRDSENISLWPGWELQSVARKIENNDSSTKQSD